MLASLLFLSLVLLTLACFFVLFLQFLFLLPLLDQPKPQDDVSVLADDCLSRGRNRDASRQGGRSHGKGQALGHDAHVLEGVAGRQPHQLCLCARPAASVVHERCRTGVEHIPRRRRELIFCARLM